MRSWGNLLSSSIRAPMGAIRSSATRVTVSANSSCSALRTGMDDNPPTEHSVSGSLTVLGRGSQRRVALDGRGLLGLVAGEQSVDGGIQFGEAVLELVELVRRAGLVPVGMGVLVAARTGRLGLLSAAWFAGMPTAFRERDELLGVVGQRLADLLLQRPVVVVEVPEEVSGARSRHARTLLHRLRQLIGAVLHLSRDVMPPSPAAA